MNESLKKIGVAFLDVLQTVVLAAAVSMVIYLFVLQPHQVKGQSMVPSFQDGEYLLTDKLTYKFGEPARGDVVILKAPATEWCAERHCEYIKRIVAKGGDKVLLEEGKVYINGKKLTEDFLPPEKFTNGGDYLREGTEVSVPQGNFLVMGDNRLHSRDGREFGPVKRSDLIGKVWVRYWPPQEAGFIPQYSF
jgi:signal peptidase I